jgi:hypothetical protein
MLGLLEVVDRDGRVRRTLPVAAWPVRVGRALDNELVLDDPHVAPHHALVEAGAEGPEVLALPSVNGVQQGRRRAAAGQRLVLAGDGSFVVGQTRLRLRLPGEALAPERPLARVRDHLVTLGFALAFWVWVLIDHAIEIDPGGRASDWIVPLVAVPAVLGLWTATWSLASKLFQHRLDFWAHLGVVARGALAIEAVAFALPWLSALTGWALPSRLAAGASLALLTVVVLAHARLVLPQQRRVLAVLAAALCVLGAGVMLALNQQRNDRWFEELYTSTLPPPALLWAPRVAPAEFAREAAALEGRLQEAVREAESERRAAGDEEDD